MSAIIDADTHVDETERTWEYLTPEQSDLKPGVGAPPVLDPNRFPTRYWMVDGRRVLRFIRSDEGTGTTTATRELMDVDARLRDMDRMGVGTQIIYPTIFLVEFCTRPEVEEALRLSYNRWLADRCANSDGRLRWVVLPPYGDIPHAVEELHFAKEHGAVGVMKKGDREGGGHWLDDEYFYPVYEAAQKLNMPLCFHTGTGTPDFTSSRNFSSGSFHRITLPVVHAFQSVVMHHIPQKFPQLRFGFIEASASWVPFVLFDLKRRMEKLGRVDRQLRSPDYELPDNALKELRLYVSCMTDEDLPYLLRAAGEDNLLTGSDYSHSDHAAELDFPEILAARATRGDFSHDIVRKITQDNPRTFYGL